VFSAASKVLASEKVTSWELKAFKYYYIPLKEIGLGGILVEPTADLIRLQDELFDAIGKFMAPGSSCTAAAFKTTVQDPEINQPPSMLLQTTSQRTGESITAHMSQRCRHDRLSGRPACCTVSHVYVFGGGSVCLSVRQLQDRGEVPPLLHTYVVRGHDPSLGSYQIT
jgi:hypothetical protein